MNVPLCLKTKNCITRYVTICCALLKTCSITYLKAQFMDDVSLCPDLLLQLKLPVIAAKLRSSP